jgi:hypothetical protein
VRRLALTASLIAAAVALGGTAPPPRGAPDARIRGAALGLFASDPAYDYDGMLAEIADRGATDVLIVVALVQRDVSAHDLRWEPGTSPHAATVRRTVRRARDRGLRVGLLPIVGLERRRPDQWRGVIRPEAGADAWFAAYGQAIAPLVAIAADEGVVRFGLGSELSALEGHASSWRTLAADVRARYDGELFYAVNWDRAGAPTFSDALDSIGVSGYFELVPPGGRATDAALRRAWEDPRRRLGALAAVTGRPVFFAEVGYPSHALAAERPWDHAAEAAIDVALQARLWAAFCDALAEDPTTEGFYAWNWFGHGGPRDRGYSPRGKPAAAVLARCWANTPAGW